MAAAVSLATAWLIPRAINHAHDAAAPAVPPLIVTAPGPSGDAAKEPPSATPRAKAAEKPAPAVEPQTKEAVAVVSSPPNSADVIRQMMPEVTDQARKTIQDKVVLYVRARVDPSGAVIDSKPEARSSRYFSQLALQSVREWKFTPAAADSSETREWRIRFEFSRTSTSATSVRVTPAP